MRTPRHLVVTGCWTIMSDPKICIQSLMICRGTNHWSESQTRPPTTYQSCSWFSKRLYVETFTDSYCAIVRSQGVQTFSERVASSQGWLLVPTFINQPGSQCVPTNAMYRIGTLTQIHQVLDQDLPEKKTMKRSRRGFARKMERRRTFFKTFLCRNI